MYACLCGDTDCPSCGTWQGTYGGDMSTAETLLTWLEELASELDEFRLAIPSIDEDYRMCHLRTAAACLEVEKVKKALEEMK